MAETASLTGRCLCGAVRFTAAKAERHVGACHCRMCRRWTGGPLLSVDCGTEVTFEGSEHISTYSSSEWGERSFCARCGSALYWRNVESGEFEMLAGLFDDQARFVLSNEIFVDEKPDWYDFAGERKRKTAAEWMATVRPTDG